MNTTTTPQSVAENVLGQIEWESATAGYLLCPGIDKHTTPPARRDCKVMVDGAPTVSCFHSSCLPDIKTASLRLRRALRRSSIVLPPASHSKTSQTPCSSKHRSTTPESWKEKARQAKAYILNDFAIDSDTFFKSSPSPLPEDPKDGWKALLQLHPPTATIWNGEPKSSGPGYENRFRKVSEWLELKDCPNLFTCPSAFKDGSISRSNDQVEKTTFLVLESDSLNHDQTCAMFSWFEQFMNLRAVVDSGGKSLHGWFDMPPQEVMDQLKVIVPELGFDPKMFTPSQPCRLPGVKRPETERMQELKYLNNVEMEEAQ